MESIDRLLPNFLVIGVVKGGTTSLYHHFSQHPDIYMSPVKEVNFFSHQNIKPELFTREYAQASFLDFDKYVRQGMSETIHIAHINQLEQYKMLFSKAGEQTLRGEISNSYMICEDAAREIYKAIPHAKLLVMLRNPINRAWSQYIMNLREGKTLEKDFQKEVLSDDAKDPKGWGINHQYLALGMYYEQIKRFKDLFKDQLHVVLYEDYKSNPEKVLGEIYQFLGLKPVFDSSSKTTFNESALPRFEKLNYFLAQTGIIYMLKRLFSRGMRQKIKTLLYTQKGIPNISPADRAFLRKIYLQDVQKLSDLLDLDLLTKWEFEKSFQQTQ